MKKGEHVSWCLHAFETVPDYLYIGTISRVHIKLYIHERFYSTWNRHIRKKNIIIIWRSAHWKHIADERMSKRARKYITRTKQCAPFASLLFFHRIRSWFYSCSGLALKIPLYLLCIYSIFNNMSLDPENATNKCNKYTNASISVCFYIIHKYFHTNLSKALSKKARHWQGMPLPLLLIYECAGERICFEMSQFPSYMCHSRL